MEKAELLRETGKYLDDYLEAFLEGKVETDPRYTHCGVEIHPSQIRNFDGEVDEEDRHSSRFYALSSEFSEASLEQFRDAVADIDGVLVVDMCSWYGERFGLWVAAQNPSAEVHVYDPQINPVFADFLFNDLNCESIFKFGKKTHYDVMHQEQSVNNLYRQNGMDNITFHQQPMSYARMEMLARQKQGRKVVFTARRINDLVSPITAAVSRCDNAEMVIAPLINLEVSAYMDDPVMKLIEKNRRIRKGQKSTDPVAPPDNARSRLFTAMQQYYSLKAASVVGESARGYRSGDLEGLSVFHHPTHYVSTVAPKRK